MKFIILFLLMSCGKLTHDVKPVNISGIVGPDFVKAAQFCDDRYGHKTEDSELCFKEYREYFKIKVTVDVEAVEEFCESRYSINQDIEDCIDDILGVL